MPWRVGAACAGAQQCSQVPLHVSEHDRISPHICRSHNLPHVCSGQELLEGELDRLVPLCARRATEAKRAACRAQAVATLEALIAYPYRLLHPFRPLVIFPDSPRLSLASRQNFKLTLSAGLCRSIIIAVCACRAPPLGSDLHCQMRTLDSVAQRLLIMEHAKIMLLQDPSQTRGVQMECEWAKKRVSAWSLMDVCMCRQVLGALSQAVDDRKRAVRAAAVRCRRRWGAQPV